uniref:Uncharacterized protein n=1 Tax=Pantoea phage Survivor TaxID=3232176 RepID=A0AAU8KXR2_9CAUD
MRKYPTPWQYLVDLIATGRLKAAYASGDRKAIANAEAAYKGLSEDEVVFSAPVTRKDGKLVVNMTCKRGFKLNDIVFNTGTLAKMVAQNANLMAAHEDLNTSQITGFYFCEDADQLHLLINPNSNLHEALKMTGYEFPPENYKTTIYPQRDDVLLAEGEIAITHPVVAGTVYVSYVQQPQSHEEIAQRVADENNVIRSQLIPETPAELLESGAPLTDLTQGGSPGPIVEHEFSKDATELAEGAADKTVAIQEAAKAEAPAEEPAQEEAPAQTQQKKKK